MQSNECSFKSFRSKVVEIARILCIIWYRFQHPLIKRCKRLSYQSDDAFVTAGMRPVHEFVNMNERTNELALFWKLEKWPTEIRKETNSCF